VCQTALWQNRQRSGCENATEEIPQFHKKHLLSIYIYPAQKVIIPLRKPFRMTTWQMAGDSDWQRGRVIWSKCMQIIASMYTGIDSLRIQY
jgi:hypothetical protein